MLSDSILSPLPQEWEKSGEEHLLKQAILTLLTSLIHSMNQESVRYHPMILPLIQSSIDTGSVSSYFFDRARVFEFDSNSSNHRKPIYT
jgi:hypothetical protein